MRPVIQHACFLNLHQPPGNLEYLLAERAWEAREILCALDRIPRSLWDGEGLGRVHLSLSGTLLETLAHTDFQRRAYGCVRLGDLLWYLQNRVIVEVLGTGYYHPALPLIPAADREEQVARWLGIGRHLFWRTNFQGFWPPEMGFCMEMIPLLRRHGYRYVLVDAEYLSPVTPLKWHELRYQPHLARHGGAEIIVVPRDRELSNAQLAGMTPDWFVQEARERTKWCDFPPLVLTCTDGDNGGWFRNVRPEANFWGAFYRPLLEKIRSGAVPDLRPVFIHDYLDLRPPRSEVIVRAGAWNTENHSGVGFAQWTGSAEQKDLLKRCARFSRELLALEKSLAEDLPPDSPPRRAIEEARWRLLRAETSCNLYWGTAWVPRGHQDLDDALAALRTQFKNAG